MKKVYMYGIVALILASLLYFTSAMQKNSHLTFFNNTDVACLTNGHQNLALHIHPTLHITVDGEPEIVPANVGISNTCMAEIHTHDASGEIHVETASAERLKELTFADFFAEWQQPIQREGYTLTMKVDGAEVSSVDQIPLKDRVQIVFAYTSVVQ